MGNNVLLTVTGAVSADIAIKTFKQMGLRIIGCDSHPKTWIIGSNEVDVFYQAPLISDVDSYLPFIKDLCLKEKIDYVVPMIDIEVDLFTKNREWFEEHNITLCISSAPTIKILRNKKLLSDFIRDNCPSIRHIPTLMLRDVKDLPWNFPIVCKPYNGRSSQGLTFLYSEEEWNEFRKDADPDLYIVEPFIEGPVVMVEIVRQPDTKKVVAMTRRELMSTPHGLSTCVNIYQDKSLEDNCKILADKLDIRGNVNFEFLLDPDGEYHFVECNPRFSAGLEFSCIGGYNCVENHIKCFMGKEIDDYRFQHPMVISRRYEEVVTAIDVVEPYCRTFH